jgi:hypothetical protein
MTANVKMTALGDIDPCSVVEVDRRFRGSYYVIRAIMETVRIIETAVCFNETTRRYIPQSCHFKRLNRKLCIL